ncbi:LamG-like jellyroll fold domain-containing protein [Planctomycetota bacterium]
MKKTISLVLVLALCMVAEVANADYTFGTPTNLGSTVNRYSNEQSPSISADGLSIFFTSQRSGGSGSDDIWVTTRETINDPWSTPVNLGSTVNSSVDDDHPSISADGLSLYFSSDRSGGLGNTDIWITTRATTNDPWTEPVNLGSTVNSKYAEWCPNISNDGLSLYFSDFITSYRPGGYGIMDIYVTTRSTVSDLWSTPVNLGPTANSSGNDLSPDISADGLTLFLECTRSVGLGRSDLYMSTRSTTDATWNATMNLGPAVNSDTIEGGPSISADGSTLYFSSERPGGLGAADLWQVLIEPFVDLNGDGIVDAGDMCMMISHWGKEYPLCDIGPMPWGDGIVNVQDLIVLSEHLFEEVSDPTLVTHWALDEPEGMFAADSVGDNDALVVGGIEWQPTGGRVDGAIQLNGVDGCAITGPVLNPADGPFLVFTWIKGGAPGQVVLSQMGEVNWLCTDASEGNLTTELAGSDPDNDPLQSQTTITDGEWHRIGFVWDGSRRTLYVDDVAVAEDTQPGLEGSQMGLYIGVGKDYAPGTFWSGLIDDIRIYKRVVSP